MENEYKKVIVVGRQFGSGGRQIARAIADKLGYNYYDREILSECAARLGFSPDLFTVRDEKRPSALRSLLHFGYGVSDIYNTSSVSSEGIYKAQSEVIRSLASEGNCVFVGRTADYVLRDNPNLVSIFLHAPLEHRAKFIISRGDAADEREASELARRMDRNRENYYNYFTGRNWGHASNYHLSVDSSRWDTDMILSALRPLL